MRSAFGLAILIASNYQTASAQSLPKEVLDALAAAPTVDTIYVQSGTPYQVPSNVLKVRRLTITPNSTMIFPESPSEKGLSDRDCCDSRGLRDLIWSYHVDPGHPAAA